MNALSCLHYALVICNYFPSLSASQSWGRAGDSHGNEHKQGFYFWFVAPVLVNLHPGFALYLQKQQCNENINCGGKQLVLPNVCPWSADLLAVFAGCKVPAILEDLGGGWGGGGHGYKWLVQQGDVWWPRGCIRKTCPWNIYFYIVKQGYVGVYLVFLFLRQNIDGGYSLSKNKKNIKKNYWKFSFFRSLKISVYCISFRNGMHIWNVRLVLRAAGCGFKLYYGLTYRAWPSSVRHC